MSRYRPGVECRLAFTICDRHFFSVSLSAPFISFRANRQGGSNADNLLADSYVKGIRSGINWSDGLQAMLKDATVSPADWGVEGRGGIAARKRLGYVPQDGGGNKPSGKNVVEGRTASRTLEVG